MSDDDKYLRDVLAEQKLANDSDEMKALRAGRDAVESVLADTFGSCAYTIRYGGSKAKGTLIKEMYDLDLVFYLHNGENGAGDTLEDVFFNVADALRDAYDVREKTSALRLRNLDATSDLHIDVVPGRFTSDDKEDCYLYQNGADKCRLKTNLDTHIAHVRDSGVLDALGLLKLLRVRRGLTVKQFAWELVAIELLKGKKKSDLADQLDHVLKAIANAEDAIAIEDPANPTGNDLMPLLESAWPELRFMAASVRSSVQGGGWRAVFGELEAEKAERAARLRRAAGGVSTPMRPWDKA